MGYDITFHPISREELSYFFYDIVADRSLAPRRVILLTADPDKQRQLLEIYSHFDEWLSPERRGEIEFSHTFAFAAAAIAGYLHPYWYTHGTWLSLLGINEKYFCRFLQSLHGMAPEQFGGIADDGLASITGNFSAGGYVEYTNLDALQEAVNVRFRSAADAGLGEQTREALNCTIDYCLHAGTGFLEACDIVVPFSAECVSDYDNFRARHLGNTTNFENARKLPAV